MQAKRNKQGLYIAYEQEPVKEVKRVHDKSGLQVQPYSYVLEHSPILGTYNIDYKDKYVLINIYNKMGNGLGGGFHVYPGEGLCWGHCHPRLMNKEEAEERLEYYKEHGFEEYC